ncbi:MAG: DUF4864 domain-containing protein [Paracoccaceae bacterium]
MNGLRGLLVAGALALTGAVGAGPGRTEGADPAAIRGVIGAQFDAFRAGDAGKAFTFASPMIRSVFGNPDNFGRMVRGGYPMIWAPSEVEFRGVRAENGAIFQRVRVRDGAGKDFLFDYEMVEGPDGWRINGVFPVRDPGVGV